MKPGKDETSLTGDLDGNVVWHHSERAVRQNDGQILDAHESIRPGIGRRFGFSRQESKVSFIFQDPGKSLRVSAAEA